MYLKYRKIKDNKMRAIEPGTILWKKVRIGPKEQIAQWPRPRCEAVAKLIVIEPGFVATYDRYSGLNSLSKARVRSAYVLEIRDLKGKLVKEGRSYSGYSDLTYKPGIIVRPVYAFDEMDEACSSGIHGFESREAARSYW